MRSLTVFLSAALVVLVGCAEPAGPELTRNPGTGPRDTADVQSGGDRDSSHLEGVLARRVNLGNRPFGAGVSSTGVYYITQLDGASMGQGRFPEAGIVGSVAVGAVPTNVIFDREGRTAYVTNQWNQSIGVVDVVTNTQKGTIAIGGDPFNLVQSVDGSRLFVTNNSDNVSVVDLGSRTIVATIPMNGDPNGVLLTKDGSRLYVSVPGTGTVYEVDPASASILRTFTPGGRPQDMASPDGSGKLYIANEYGSLDIIDLANGAVEQSIPLRPGPFGLASSPDGRFIIVAQTSGYLTFYNRATSSIVKEVEIRGLPRKLGLTADGRRLVLANEAGWVDFIK